MDAPERLDDLWSRSDYPILQATARLLAERRRHAPTTQEIAAAVEIDKVDVVSALTRLGHLHLELADISTYGGRDYLVTGITPDGLREVGQWPSPESAADRLIAALDALIDNTTEGSPRQGRLRAARDGLLSAGRDVLVEVAGAAITGRIPM